MLVIFAAVVVHVLAALLVAATVYGLYRLGRRAWRWHRGQVALAAHQRAELLARAEIQHRWYLASDRGPYGRYQPAGMNYVVGGAANPMPFTRSHNVTVTLARSSGVCVFGVDSVGASPF